MTLGSDKNIIISLKNQIILYTKNVDTWAREVEEISKNSLVWSENYELYYQSHFSIIIMLKR